MNTEVSKKDLKEWGKAGLVVIEAIHPVMTKNLNVYTEGALESAYESFTAPYPKPQIVNHDMHTEVEGRVVKAAWGESVLKPGSKTVFVGIDIPDKGTREKWQRGLYRTTSVGASVSSVTCSICEKDLVKEGYCGHLKGRQYEGRTAKWIINALREFDEISRVNAPADEYSQSINHLLEETGGAREGREHDMADELKEMEQLLGELDQMAAEEGTETAEGAGSPEGDQAATEAASTEEGAEGGEATTEGATQTSEVDTLKAELEKTKEKITALETENADLQTKVQEADTVRQELSATQAQLTAAEEESKLALKKNAELARSLHRQLAERMADIQILTGKTVDARESVVAGLAKEKATALYAQLKESVPTRAVREQVVPVTNPAIVTGAQDGIVTEGAGSGKKTYSLAEAEEILAKALSWNK